MRREPKPKKFPKGIKQSYGEMPASVPPGYFKAIRFPTLVVMDELTGDHRKILSEGFLGPRNLPMSIKCGVDHDNAEVTGGLFEVTYDPDDGVLSGRGFLLNDEHGRRHARLVYTKAMDRNSIEMAEVKVRFVEDLEADEWWAEFYEWALAATCGVPRPAFADAHAVIDEMSDEELMASLGDPMEELVADLPFEVALPQRPKTEITAGAIVAPYDAFFVPEASKPRKMHADENGWVSGHIALWDTCHDGIEGQCIIPPRPPDAYASFNKPGLLTDKGVIEAGPVFMLGGHRSLLGAKDVAQAYGGIENAWCDVRVVPGQFGPWASGFVRPGVDEKLLYAARASRISGHWLGGRLKAIVACNAEGYDVPGSGELAASFEFAMDDDGVVTELVASFPDCVDDSADEGTEIVLHLRVDELTASAVASAAITQLGLEDGESERLLALLLADEPDL